MAEKPDFSQYSLDELNEIAEEAQEAITRRRAEALETARRAATEAAMKHGFSLRDLVETMPGMGPAKSKYPPKYRNPDNPNQTWSGRGRQPAWFKSAFAKGKTRDDLTI